MELAWLQDFVALQKERSFSRAARTRNVTQPAFSRRVRALEHWAGARLFERGSQGATLTVAGEVFARGAPDLLAQANALRARTREAGENATGILRFAATQTLSFTFFPDWIRSAGRFDLGLVQISAANMALCEEMVTRGEADFLVCHWHEAASDPFDAQLPHRTIGRDRLVCVRSPGLPWPGTEGAPTPHLSYEPSSALGRILAACEPVAIGRAPRTARFTSHLAAALRSLAMDGEGTAWLPMTLVSGDLSSGRLVRVAGEGEDVAIDIRLYLASGASAAARQFWDGLDRPL